MISQWVTFFVTAVARNLLLNIYVCIYIPNFDIPTENNSLEISWPFKHGLILDIYVEFQGGMFLGPSIFSLWNYDPPKSRYKKIVPFKLREDVTFLK